IVSVCERVALSASSLRESSTSASASRTSLYARKEPEADANRRPRVPCGPANRRQATGTAFAGAIRCPQPSSVANVALGKRSMDGSITSSAVMPSSYVGVCTVFPPASRRSFCRSSGGLPLRDVRIRLTQKLLVDLADARLCQTVDELDLIGDAVFRDD